MMRDFEYIGLEFPVGFQQRFFLFESHISGEQHGKITVNKAEHHRIVVDEIERLFHFRACGDQHFRLGATAELNDKADSFGSPISDTG